MEKLGLGLFTRCQQQQRSAYCVLCVTAKPYQEKNQDECKNVSCFHRWKHFNGVEEQEPPISPVATLHVNLTAP